VVSSSTGRIRGLFAPFPTFPIIGGGFLLKDSRVNDVDDRDGDIDVSRLNREAEFTRKALRQSASSVS